MILRSILVEDERRSRNILKKFLSSYCKDVHIIGEAATIKEALSEIKIKKPNLVFLDIELKDGKGLDLLDHFNQQEFVTIFVSGYDSYAIQAIKKNAVDYVLKPIVIKDLISAVEKAKKKLKDTSLLKDFYAVNTFKKVDNDHLILQTTKQNLKVVNPQEIVYIEAQNQYTKWHLLSESSIMIRKPLASLTDMLPNFFFQIHRCYIINLDLVTSLEKGRCSSISINNKNLPVSARRKKEFLSELRKRRMKE